MSLWMSLRILGGRVTTYPQLRALQRILPSTLATALHNTVDFLGTSPWPLRCENEPRPQFTGLTTSATVHIDRGGHR